MSKFIDLTGKKFERLTVIKWVGKDKWRNSRWLCQCSCKDKNEKIVLGSHLGGGRIKSCGCLRKEITSQRSIEHGHKKNGKVTEIYTVWQNMKQRCGDSNHKSYKNYGGRGITVCEEWSHSFTNFKRDNPDWKPGLTIERDNNELGYFKGNCYWGTRTEQTRNRRNTLYVPYNGKNRLLVELCEEHDMPYKIVYDRIYKLGWSVEKALTTPVRKHKKYKKRRKNE